MIGWYKLTVSRFVTQRWYVVIAIWIVAAVALKTMSPQWKDIAADGDLQFLPADSPSAVGQAELDSAFPGTQARSQMVVVFADHQQKLTGGDVALAMDVGRHLHWIVAKSAWNLLQNRTEAMPAVAAQIPTAAESAETDGEAVERQNMPTPDAIAERRESVLAEIVRDNINQAIDIEDELSGFLVRDHPNVEFARLPDAFLLRSQIMGWLHEEPDQVALDLDTHNLLHEQADSQLTRLLEPSLPHWASHLIDVWSWRNNVVGHKLNSAGGNARLIALQLDTDFTAVSNIDVMTGVEDLIEQLQHQYQGVTSNRLEVEISGSAAIGADMLRAAASGVRVTEMVTIALVLLILSVVYRAPFLVAIPITSIGLSLVVATSVISLLARDPNTANSWGLGVFTTTRIFIVVILFGAGTDFCLFLLARNRELLNRDSSGGTRKMQRIVAKGWLGVHDALTASALTTMVGLGLMWFSDFEKFQFSGPIIAISLGITLLVCLTFTPAVCSGLGRLAYWPTLPRRKRDVDLADSPQWGNKFWQRLATGVVSHPARALVIALALLFFPAAVGVYRHGDVTYDLTQELSESAPSRKGQSLIQQYFPTQSASPITILVRRGSEFVDDAALKTACRELSAVLYVEGVDAVRNLTDPLGDYPPGRRKGLFAKDAWWLRILDGHRVTREKYVSSLVELERRVARFDVVISANPFSLEAADVLAQLTETLDREVSRPDSLWFEAGASVSGTTAGITDLRRVTQADQRRIQILVTLGVWGVLLILLRKPVLSCYLILSVLLSYFSTLGLTHWVFAGLYGPDYGGLDWKVPLFLFVILVAVGQDYNVYLVTRIFEEQKRFGHREGVRRALYLTGGIITSCGLVMAGTFIAMTSPAIYYWLSGVLPAGWIKQDTFVLRGITELGFALASGVMLDTLIVRSILVPAFVTLWGSPAAATGTNTGVAGAALNPDA